MRRTAVLLLTAVAVAAPVAGRAAPSVSCEKHVAEASAGLASGPSAPPLQPACEGSFSGGLVSIGWLPGTAAFGWAQALDASGGIVSEVWCLGAIPECYGWGWSDSYFVPFLGFNPPPLCEACGQFSGNAGPGAASVRFSVQPFRTTRCAEGSCVQVTAGAGVFWFAAL